MQQKKDIFDRMMALPVLNIFEPFYKKNKEVLLYLFFGGLAFLLSLAVYAYFNIVLEMNELVANVISWIITVLFAFITNRIWVFAAPTNGTVDFFKQMISFFGGRVITLVIEELILLLFITYMGLNSIVVKVIAQVVVIVLNYVISKLIVFRK